MTATIDLAAYLLMVNYTCNQKPITYDKEAKAERFEQFLSEVLYNRDIRTAVEAMAYTFERDYPIEVIFMLYGFGANVKTVYTSTLTALEGKDNVSNVSLSAKADKDTMDEQQRLYD